MWSLTSLRTKRIKSFRTFRVLPPKDFFDSIGQTAKNSLRANLVCYAPIERTSMRRAVTSLMGQVQTSAWLVTLLNKKGLLPTEWVNLDIFLQVAADFKGFLVNRTVMSSQACCAHAKIRQEETTAG
jgi:hypothetical protein